MALLRSCLAKVTICCEVSLMHNDGAEPEMRIFWESKNSSMCDLKFGSSYPVYSSNENDGGMEFGSLRWQDCAINLSDPSSIQFNKVTYLLSLHSSLIFILTALHLQDDISWIADKCPLIMRMRSRLLLQARFKGDVLVAMPHQRACHELS